MKVMKCGENINSADKESFFGDQEEAMFCWFVFA